MDASPAPKDSLSSLLGPDEVCQFLGIARRTLWRWVAAGVVPEPIRFNQRVVRWRRDVIAALANKSK